MTFSIIYRAYAGETEGNLSRFRPNWFSKFNCWKSFWAEFGNISDIKISVLWDGECNGGFYDYIKSFGVKIINFGKIGNKEGLLKTYELLKQTDTQIVATHEDDYLVLPGCLNAIQEGFGYGFPIFCTYEHPDRFLIPSTDVSWGKEEIYKGNNCYFRSVESTTGTCFFTKPIFDKVYDKLVQHNVNDRSFFRNCYYNGIRLYSTSPGYSTHVCIDGNSNLMSPFIDWKNFNSTIKL